MKKVLLISIAIVFALLLSNTVFSQGVAINTDGTSANSSAMLDIKSTTTGMLIPRMDLSQRDLISSPATGLLIFQTDNTPGFYYYNGSGWQRIGTGNVESMTFTGPLSSTGGSTPTISISQSGAANGQALEWNGSAWAPANDDNTTYSAGNQLGLTGTTFNVSEGTGSGLDGDMVDGQHYSDIQSWVNTNDDNTTYSAGTGLTLTGTEFTPTFGTAAGTVATGNHGHTNMVTGTGTLNYVSKWTSSGTTLGNSQIIDDGTNVGIGMSPGYKLDVNGSMRTTSIFDANDIGYFLDPSSVSSLNDVRGNIFYDRANTSFYLDPAGTSILNDVRATIYYDRLNTSFYLVPSNVSMLNDVRASIIYDRDNTNFYVDPASTTRLTNLNLVSALSLNGSTGAAGQVLTTNGATPYWAIPVTSATAWQLTGNTGTSMVTNFIGTTDLQDLVFKTNNSEKMRIAAGGNIGIGTTTPNAGLHLYQDRYTLYGPNSTWGAYLQVGGNGRTNTTASVVATNGNLHIDAANGGGFATYINYYSQNNTYLNGAAGNVGIGNTGPSYKLDVTGDIRSTNKIWANANGASYFRGGDDAELWDVNVANTLAIYGLQNSTVATIRLGSGASDISGSGGNIGIGTTSPLQKLHVVGQIAINDNNTRVFEGSGDALRVQTSTGYTEIGPQNASWAHFSTDRPRFYFNTGLTVDSGNIGTYDENLSLQTSGTTRVTVLNSNGYVGIGTTTPSYSLHVPSGYIGTDYINTTDNAVGSGVTGIMVKAGDNYHRTANAAAVLTFLGVTAPTGDNLGNHTATTTLNLNNNQLVIKPDVTVSSGNTGIHWHGAGDFSYSIYQEAGAWSSPYPDLMIRFHTGLKLSANGSYGGVSIFTRGGENISAQFDDNLTLYGNLNFTQANPTISASSYFIAPGGAYFNSGTVYTEAQYQCRGGIHDDAHANLTIAGGTSGTTYFAGPISGINGYYPANYMIRLTPNLHLNSLAGNAVILNWDNGTTGNTSTLRIGNGAGADVFQVWAAGNTGINTAPSANYYLNANDFAMTSGTNYSNNSSRSVINGADINSQTYEFGTTGYSWNDYTRCGGVLGSQWHATYWGSLGYKNSGSTTYGLYYTSAGSGTGFMASNGVLSGVGSGGYGELMGGWSRGELMGFTTSGEMYALYNDGNSYTEGYSADIVKTDEGRKAAYSVTSTELKVYDDGSYEINGNEIFVSFDKDFASMINPAQNPTITVSPVGGWAPLYIKEIRQDGFVVANDNYNGNNVKFSWIAVAERIDSENAELPKDIADDKFNENLKGFMFNENITNRNATPMWWDGSTLRFDAIPEKPIDEAAKKAEEERMKNQ